MDAFALRKQVIQEYSSYVHSFLRIRDLRIENFVSKRLEEGALWPEALLQLNPAYESGPTVSDLTAQGILHPLCSAIFGDTRLHRHQHEAILAAQQHEHFVLTTGTGSGKSLTYIIPIFDHVLKHRPEEKTVRAIICYPMNALINSQQKALEAYAANLCGSPCPVTFKRYTGQESDTAKAAIRENPPHILLTNYVMLEYILTRPDERAFVDRAASALQFLVLDELHSYRGRQGADVAMLARRVRERCGNADLICIGTSATMVAGGTRVERRKAVAEVASKIFGVTVKPDNVIEESLRRTIPRPTPPTAAELTAALNVPTSSPSWDEFSSNPLSAWIEDTFGIIEEEGILTRRTPISLRYGAEQLAAATGVDVVVCEKRLREMFRIGSEVTNSSDGSHPFAFKLHQFISQGGAVYTTLEAPSGRLLTLDGQHYAPGDGGDRLLFPLVFCRECGQEYCLGEWSEKERHVRPRSPLASFSEPYGGRREGYLLLDTDPDAPLWSESDEDSLPDGWFNFNKSGRGSVKSDFREFIPRRLHVRADGTVTDGPETGTVQCWFLPRPFLTCLHCGVVYTRRDRDDFRKLSRLSSEGRSTATTLLSISAISHLRREASVEEEARKLLSFTDNRQDASLQAGHFNDFVEVARLRSAIYNALPDEGALDHTDIASRTVGILALPQEAYAKEVGRFSGAARRNLKALEALVEFRIYEDLRRGWRVNQPNLEQCGLLQMDYLDLEEVCAEHSLWTDHLLLAQANAGKRLFVVRALLNYMRHSLAISAECLRPDRFEALKRRIREALKEPWTFDENEFLRAVPRFRPPDSNGDWGSENSLSPRSALGRFLRNKETWGLTANLSEGDYAPLPETLVVALRGAHFLVEVDEETGVQLRSDCLMWKRGTATTVEPDPVRSRRLQGNRDRAVEREVNTFFRDFYVRTANHLADMEGREHTGQTSKEDREDRETRFRDGLLACLFCSPTMELGIDIRDLNVVHMRNVPPTPANYAQRSGRAGRSGQPAFIATYCSVGSGHDQYFFRRREQMVAGSVAPPRLDLGNEDLIRAHVHAVWLSETGLRLGNSLTEALDTSNVVENYPLHANIAEHTQLSESRRRECRDACHRILQSCPEAVTGNWHSDEWLETVLRNTPKEFDAACNRWREMFAAADHQLAEARAFIDRSHQTRIARQEVDEARQREREALRQKDVLCCTNTKSFESDFYPYRYLASEGFLPGYNFPRLPVRAFVPTRGKEGDFISRARFLALNEFGPRNIIYHEGEKYRVVRSLLPPGTAEGRFTRAKLCVVCGYFHDDQSLKKDRCEHCDALLDGDNCQFVDKLFEMTTVSTQRANSITSDEEERVRTGYEITTHFRFPPDADRRLRATVEDAHGHALLELTYVPAATLWRINHKWRRGVQDGFTFDPTKGVWGKRPDDEEDNALDAGVQTVHTGVRVYVHDTHNLLLIHAPQGESFPEERLCALQFALKRGIETVFQVEDSELASERIGKEAQRGILLYEAAEGGAGVLNRLVDEAGALERVAAAALDVCHFDAEGNDLRAAKDGGGMDDACARACYDCLLSYTNQMDHPLINRHAVRDLLLQLLGSVTRRGHGGRNYQAHYEWLRSLTDTRSELERKFLDHLYRSNRRLPDHAQRNLEDYPCCPDFFYDDGRACAFCDGSVHDSAEQQAEDRRVRADLEDGGYRVVVIRYDQDIEAQVGRYADVFGEGKTAA